MDLVIAQSRSGDCGFVSHDKLKIWSSSTGRCHHTLLGHTSTVRSIKVYRDLAVSGSRDRSVRLDAGWLAKLLKVRLWNIRSGALLKVYLLHEDTVRCVSLDDRNIISASYDAKAIVWNKDTVSARHVLSGHSNRIYSLEVSFHVTGGFFTRFG